MAEQKGRRKDSQLFWPRKMTMTHVISLSPELEEKIDNLTGAWLGGKSIRAAGEIFKGIVTTPIGIAAVGAIFAYFGFGFLPDDVKDEVKTTFTPFAALERDVDNVKEAGRRLKVILDRLFGKGGPIFGRPGS